MTSCLPRGLAECKCIGNDARLREAYTNYDRTGFTVNLKSLTQSLSNK